MDDLTRREFLGAGCAAALAGVGAAAPAAATVETRASAQADRGFRGSVCFFSKHLPRMDARRLGRTLRTLGFDGVDLTVRPKGHIEPARVAQDLPPFVSTLREEGLAVPMITTELLSGSDTAARPTLETAAALKIPFFKPGYYRYTFADVRKERDEAAAKLRSLAELSARYGVRLGYHNHSGSYVGEAIWDVAPAIDALDPQTAGYYFDVRHAVVEGGDAGWRTAFGLAAPRLLMIALKDFYWERTAAGWRVRNCPLGEGMVDWKRFFGLLAKANFHGPASLHLEYDIPGTTPDALEENTIAATARDLAFVRARIQEAYAGGAS